VRSIVGLDAMAWLPDSDVGAGQGFARALADARTVAEVRNRTLAALSELVPADVMTWDRVEVDSGAVRQRGVSDRGRAARGL
jgi:hypothetical protein